MELIVAIGICKVDCATSVFFVSAHYWFHSAPDGSTYQHLRWYSLWQMLLLMLYSIWKWYCTGSFFLWISYFLCQFVAESISVQVIPARSRWFQLVSGDSSSFQLVPARSCSFVLVCTFKILCDWFGEWYKETNMYSLPPTIIWKLMHSCKQWIPRIFKGREYL